MAEIEIGLCTVVGDVDLPVLIGAHRAGIDVEVGVELPQPDLEPARLQQRAERRCRETLAERGDHAAGNKDEPRHGTPVYSIRGARYMVKKTAGDWMRLSARRSEEHTSELQS